MVPVTGTEQHEGGAMILAAGFSRRFGHDKRLAPMPSGEPMMFATLARYQEAFANVAIVVRSDDTTLQASLRSGASTVRIITTDRAGGGLGCSLADGVRAIADWAYVFVALADMPFVNAATLVRLRESMTTAPADGVGKIVQPRYGAHGGHPVGFARTYFDQLRALDGDRGARSVLIEHRARVVNVDVDDEGVLRDVDAPADLGKL
jgi:molybdenum cofactor cytidylyltransferase